jgi:hypothetical protein
MSNDVFEEAQTKLAAIFKSIEAETSNGLIGRGSVVMVLLTSSTATKWQHRTSFREIPATSDNHERNGHTIFVPLRQCRCGSRPHIPSRLLGANTRCNTKSWAR